MQLSRSRFTSLEWGAPDHVVGAAVQARVAKYVARTAKLGTVGVDVIVDDVSRSAAP